MDEQQAPQQHPQPVSQAAESAVQQASEQQLAAPSEQQAIDVDNVQVPVIDLSAQEDQQPEPSQVEVSQDQQQVAAVDPYQQPLPQLPQKRTFDEAEIMFTLIAQENGTFTRPHAYWDGSPALGFGPVPRRCHMAYLASQQRQEDLVDSYKDHNESDTTQGSDTDESDPGEQDNETQVHKQGLSRMELKALDREIPWQRIAEMPQQYQDRFLEAINKEAESWSTWQSVQPLSDQEAEKIFRDPVLGKRVLRSRACYRDKSFRVGEMRRKCRVVALGHLDPDLGSIHRNSATPGRAGRTLRLWDDSGRSQLRALWFQDAMAGMAWRRRHGVPTGATIRSSPSSLLVAAQGRLDRPNQHMAAQALQNPWQYIRPRECAVYLVQGSTEAPSRSPIPTALL